MKNKLAVGLALVLIFTLSVGLTGCVGKVTGGGFLQECDRKVTFGFNVQLTEEDGVIGQFQLVDHLGRPPIRIHGTFDDVDWIWLPLIGTQYIAEGLCTVSTLDPKGPYKFYLYAYDDGEPGIDDYIYVYLVIPSDPDIVYEGTIDGGNIQVHEDDD